MIDLESRLSAEERTSFAQIVARSWSDEDFAGEYARDPRATLAAYGIECPSDAEAPLLPARPDLDMEVHDLSLAGAVADGYVIQSVSNGCGCCSSSTY
ncbi:hypothetical protein ADK75_03775 [Streptomyces virginiae]|uniref:Uncharacterized protein n=1 Tax=Streptomyces virginiae TaxID=1961 RepID=A0A0L8N4P5_STRVG|nr:hypothetical protein [Streptomyces virginiae]KOG57525.1 hypothetical protein ADK75_03775 [Streptomyces virginiae]